MSTIQEVRVAEEKVKELLREIKKGDLAGQDDLHQQLARAKDEYLSAIKGLEIR